MHKKVTSLDYQQYILDIADIGSWVLNLQTLKAERSLKHDQIFGYKSLLPDWSYGMFMDHVYPGDKEHVGSLFKKAIDTGVPWDFECRIQTNDDRLRWIWAKGKSVYENDGQTRLLVGIVVDITDKKKKEELIRKALREKEVLLSEIHHRVKNNLAIVSGLLRLQARKVKDKKLKAVLKESESRVFSMSMIHEMLYKQDDFSRVDFGSYLEKLFDRVNDAIGQPGGMVTCEVVADEAYLDMATAVPLGLVLNELFNNAFIHAFPDRDKGHISISLTEVEGNYTLVFQDDGIGLPDGKEQKGSSLGLELVHGLIHQVGGEVAIDSHTGTRFTISFDEPETDRSKPLNFT